jgi:hypothetical protein
MYEDPKRATIAALGLTLLAAPAAISIPVLSVFGGFGTAGVKASALLRLLYLLDNSSSKLVFA